MSQVHLVRVATFEPFLHFLQSGGCDIPRHLNQTGIPRDLLECQENLVPLRLVCEFLANIAAHEQIDGFGLEVGRRTSILDLGIFGEVIRRSLSLQDLLLRLERWVPALDSGASVWIDSTATPDCIRLCVQQDTNVGCGVVDGFNLTLLVNTIRLAAGPEWRPRRIWITSEAASAFERFEELSEARVECGVDYAALEIPANLLPLPLRPQNHSLPGNEPEEDLDATAPPTSLPDSIYTALRSSFGAPTPSIVRMAEWAGMSVRTLQRHLSREALDFSEVVDRARFHEAGMLLQAGEKNMAEISRHLGYSDPAHFTHAFRRWTGTSPTLYVSQVNKNSRN